MQTHQINAKDARQLNVKTAIVNMMQYCLKNKIDFTKGNEAKFLNELKTNITELELKRFLASDVALNSPELCSILLNLNLSDKPPEVNFDTQLQSVKTEIKATTPKKAFGKFCKQIEALSLKNITVGNAVNSKDNPNGWYSQLQEATKAVMEFIEIYNRYNVGKTDAERKQNIEKDKAKLFGFRTQLSEKLKKCGNIGKCLDNSHMISFKNNKIDEPHFNVAINQILLLAKTADRDLTDKLFHVASYVPSQQMITVQMVEGARIKIKKKDGSPGINNESDRSNNAKAQLNYSQAILTEFQNIIKETNIPGTYYINPYTNKKEQFPKDPTQFTVLHMHIIGRNEKSNTTGKMDVNLYDDLLTANQVGKIRGLIKSTTGSALTTVHAYNSGKNKITNNDESRFIVIDQAGLQWQDDLRNVGGMFFYPDKTHKNYKSYPTDFHNDLYKVTYGKERPTDPGRNSLDVVWNYGDGRSISGKIDLNEMRDAILIELMQAIEATAAQGNNLNAHDIIDFRYLKAGFGFFMAGIIPPYSSRVPDSPDIADKREKLECARLEGIKTALAGISSLDDQSKKVFLGKIKAITLPFTNEIQSPARQKLLDEIKNIVEAKLNLEFSCPNEDCLKPRKGYVVATTNCGDPHAMPSNEGGQNYPSVDVRIATDANVMPLNAAWNDEMQPRLQQQFIVASQQNVADQSASVSAPTASSSTSVASAPVYPSPSPASASSPTLTGSTSAFSPASSSNVTSDSNISRSNSSSSEENSGEKKRRIGIGRQRSGLFNQPNKDQDTLVKRWQEVANHDSWSQYGNSSSSASTSVTNEIDAIRNIVNAQENSSTILTNLKTYFRNNPADGVMNDLGKTLLNATSPTAELSNLNTFIENTPQFKNLKNTLT